MKKGNERWTLPQAARGCCLDASALAKPHWNEDDSGALNRAIEGREDLLASQLSITETLTAGARRCREGRLAPRELAAVRDMILAHREKGVFECIALTPRLHREAEHLIERLTGIPLRASDALHLAQAVAGGASVVVTFDERLARAAEASGLRAFPQVA